MAVVIASNLRKEFAGNLLFDGVSFKLERRDRLALAGPNGAGKTTLLRMLTGETSIEGGELVVEKGTRVALHDQRPPLDRDLSLREYILSGASDLLAAERELARLEEAMAQGAADQATLSAYARAQARLEHAGGYAWRDHTGAVARGLGFRDEDFDRRLATFSGGELTRASLARALAGDPDLILLDEPTNHLDVASLEWLERELSSLDAACMIVAHDRWFLEAVTNATLELEAGRSTYFPGPWHVWRLEKAQRAAHAQKTADRVAADIARLERFVARFRYKKSKAKQAQAKLTQIGRLSKEKDEASAEAALLTRRTRGLGFDFGEPKRSGRDVLVLEDEQVEVAGRRLLDHVTFALERGDHVALVGPNGSGKTTLLEHAVAGDYKLGHGVEVGYFSQHGLELDDRGSVLDCVQRDDRAEPAAGADAPRPLPLLRLGRPHEAGARSLRRRAAPARPRRSSSPPARTSSCSTSRRTTSTSTRARRSRRRSRGFPGRCSSSRTTARSSTRSRSGRRRSRTARCGSTTAAGRISCARARSVRSRPSRSRARARAEGAQAGGCRDAQARP